MRVCFLAVCSCTRPAGPKLGPGRMIDCVWCGVVAPCSSSSTLLPSRQQVCCAVAAAVSALEASSHCYCSAFLPPRVWCGVHALSGVPMPAFLSWVFEAGPVHSKPHHAVFSPACDTDLHSCRGCASPHTYLCIWGHTYAHLCTAL